MGTERVYIVAIMGHETDNRFLITTTLHIWSEKFPSKKRIIKEAHQNGIYAVSDILSITSMSEEEYWRFNSDDD